MIYTRQDVDVLLERQRQRIGKQVCAELCARYNADTDEQQAFYESTVGVEPLHAPDEPAPTVAWGREPSAEEFKAHGEEHPADRYNNGAWLAAQGEDIRRVVLKYKWDAPDNCSWLPLDSNDLPCARPNIVSEQ